MEGRKNEREPREEAVTGDMVSREWVMVDLDVWKIVLRRLSSHDADHV